MAMDFSVGFQDSIACGFLAYKIIRKNKTGRKKRFNARDFAAAVHLEIK
jgi:hypothetical protein